MKLYICYGTFRNPLRPGTRVARRNALVGVHDKQSEFASRTVHEWSAEVFAAQSGSVLAGQYRLTIVARDLHVCEWPPLHHAQLTQSRELEQSEQRRQNLPGRRVSANHVCPLHTRFDREQIADEPHGRRHIEWARDDVVHVRLRHHPEHPIHRGQQLGQ